jgi:hypothetical protein
MKLSQEQFEAINDIILERAVSVVKGRQPLRESPGLDVVEEVRLSLKSDRALQAVIYQKVADLVQGIVWHEFPEAMARACQRVHADYGVSASDVKAVYDVQSDQVIEILDPMERALQQGILNALTDELAPFCAEALDLDVPPDVTPDVEL